jgi:hypothetical protein
VRIQKTSPARQVKIRRFASRYWTRPPKKLGNPRFEHRVALSWCFAIRN